MTKRESKGKTPKPLLLAEVCATAQSDVRSGGSEGS